MENIKCLRCISMILLFLQIAFGLQCDNKTICSTDLSFCTPVGCVYECPTGSYINGSSCVSHCDLGFVLNKRCVSECPKNYNYTFEIIYTDNNLFRKLIQCLASCPEGQFIHNKYCVTRCPDQVKYIENQHCVRACKNKSDVFNDIIYNNKTLGIECTERCPHDKTYIDNNKCVEKCASKYMLNNVCMDICPDASYVHYKYSYAKERFPQYYVKQLTDQLICALQCPFMSDLIQNGECVDRCSNGYNLHKMTECVKECPSDAPYIRNGYERNDYGYERIIFKNPRCSTVCPMSDGYYVTNNSLCMKGCPKSHSFSLDGSCVLKCTDTYPYKKMDNWNNTFICKSDCPGDFLNNKTCVIKCDQNQYIHGNNCVDSCPKRLPFIKSLKICEDNCAAKVNVCSCETERHLYNNTCVDECPKSDPMVEFIGDRSFCVNMCSKNKYNEENICVSYCSPNRKLFNGSCLVECPLSQPITFRSNNGVIQCRNSCPAPYFLQNKTCDLECNNNTYLIDGICTEDLSECPNIQKFYMTIKSNQIGSSYNKCLPRCPYPYLPNRQNECIDCKMYIYNNTCVKECQNEIGKQLLEYHNKTGNYCIKACSPGTFVFNNTCIDVCPSLNFKNSCVRACPDHAPYEFSRSCVKACPVNMFISENKCVKTCSNFSVLDNATKTCYSIGNCPKERKFVQERKCVERCTDERVLSNISCITHQECDKNIIFNGQCISQCPIGYFWNKDSSLEFFGCSKIQTNVIDGVCGLILVLLMCCGLGLWYDIKPCRLLMKSLFQKKRKKKSKRRKMSQSTTALVVNSPSIEESQSTTALVVNSASIEEELNLV